MTTRACGSLVVLRDRAFQCVTPGVGMAFLARGITQLLLSAGVCALELGTSLVEHLIDSLDGRCGGPQILLLELAVAIWCQL